MSRHSASASRLCPISPSRTTPRSWRASTASTWTLPAAWRDDALAAKWERIRAIRRVITGALEIERREKRIGASLQAAPTVYLRPEDLVLLEGQDLAELSITSAIRIEVGTPPAGAFALEEVVGVAVVPGLAEGQKCARCWQVLPEVTSSPLGLCGRCGDATSSARG